MSAIVAAASVRTVCVVGAGTMGAGIAEVAARAGLETTVNDIRPDLVERGLERVRASLAEAVARGRTPAEERDRALERLRGGADLEAAAAGADVVIEAVPEDLDLKRRTFERLGAVCRPDALLATNTSSLSVTAIATAAKEAARVLGLHFFNPPPAMKLLEVVRGERTADAAVETARGLAARLGKEPIVVRDSPGFASSRLGIAIALEAMRMVEAGVASAGDIDKAMELGYRHPMGPLRLTDLVGLDVRLAIAEHLHREIGEVFRPPQILKRLVRAGKLGRKTGEGFYRYDGAC